MPFGPPPRTHGIRPHERILPSGTQLWRIHQAKYGPAEFSGVLADPHFGGGRFDATPSMAYGYLYAALTDHASVSETLLRDLPFEPGRPRIVPRRMVAGRVLSQLRTTAELRLVALISSPDLAAVKQDEWLIHAQAKEYAFTRRWGHWLRERAPWAQGLIWSTRRDLGEASLLIFRDRCPDGVLASAETSSLPLDDSPGAARLNSMLSAYGAYVYPPRNTDGGSE